MDFGFFERLSAEEAHAFLEEYRATAAQNHPELAALMARDGHAADFSLTSIRPAFEVVARAVQTVPRESDPTLPAWITTQDSYRRGLYDIAEASTGLILALSYYLAEAFIRASNGRLTWRIGDPDTAVQQQPVVSGFAHRIQMSPLLVSENLLGRLIEEPDPAVAEHVSEAVETWQNLIPGASG
jgi:hypothetical protein